MVGYVVADKPEMKVKEYELYNSYYCGVCKSIGRRHGLLPRMVLSYDSAFLAALLSSLDYEEEKVIKEHCLVHPVKKKNICIENAAIDYAADIMIILAYHKLLDDIMDEKSIKAQAMKLMFESTYKRLEKEYPSFCSLVGVQLSKLSKMEEEKCDSLDMTSDSFAEIMREAACGYKGKALSSQEQLALGVMGFHLGKWMYIIDAFDDIEENIKDGNYNPLLYRFEYDSQKETVEEFKERILPRTEMLLFNYLGEMSKAYELLDIKKNKGLLNNIVYFGLNRKTEQITKKGKEQDERSL